MTSFRNRSAFTLVELMISIALVLFLLLGVNQVFTYTTQAVGAGEAINSAIRNSRAAEATFANDFNGLVPNGSGPTDAGCMIISSRAAYAFRDAKDLASQGTIDSTGTGTGLPNAAFQDFNNDGISGNTAVPGEVTYPATYNGRNHRLDCLSFFARNTYYRQTGNPFVFAASMAAPEAWVWYGHLWLPDNSSYNYVNSYPFTGTAPNTFPAMGTSTATNPNNLFGSQLVLGRVAMLLQPKDSTGNIYDSAGTKQWFVQQSAVADLTPLMTKSSTVDQVATSSTDPGPYTLQDSRIDVADTSITLFHSKLNTYLASAAASNYWCDWMMDGNFNPPAALGIAGKFSTRFKCNPFVTKPELAADMAQASPYMLPGCSQFIVEFAGDFLTQDNDPTHVDATGKPSAAYGNGPTPHPKYGDVIAPVGGDGQLDFSIINIGTATPNYVKQTKWYGMPRGTAGQATVCSANGDVVPLRDWLQQAVTTSDVPAPAGPAAFEKYYPTYQPADYGNGNMTQTQAATGYTCALGPNDTHPKLIRITITLEDPTGRLPNGQTYQYVFTVPPNASGQ